MFITVAGIKKEVEDGTTIEKLILDEKIENAEYVTVTVNDEFARREDFDKKALGDNDVVEFLYFMGGGSF
ncbi:sulfur carrier protein [Mobilisporobacter senegalensis]|uniref:Sulfur carrier protein n=1 Tax=Mobilisporobacter senegalensis TaxID=1329262 RepID=A0A3N1XNM7_9FIRM|nr:sulfur carrier protein ThiS [Mobilisporobacter senegalensis]ROR28293.1 sulfur carrier protein [Mobilisporobacter senegalensis]